VNYFPVVYLDLCNLGFWLLFKLYSIFLLVRLITSSGHHIFWSALNACHLPLIPQMISMGIEQQNLMDQITEKLLKSSVVIFRWHVSFNQKGWPKWGSLSKNGIRCSILNSPHYLKTPILLYYILYSIINNNQWL
jgi:hypothetical protein